MFRRVHPDGSVRAAGSRVHCVTWTQSMHTAVAAAAHWSVRSGWFHKQRCSSSVGAEEQQQEEQKGAERRREEQRGERALGHEGAAAAAGTRARSGGA